MLVFIIAIILGFISAYLFGDSVIVVTVMSILFVITVIAAAIGIYQSIQL